MMVFDKYIIDEYELGVLDASLGNQPDFVAAVRNKNYTMKDMPGASYRLINHWESLGLLDDYRYIPGIGWRRFSFRDMMLIRIFSVMRSFGMNTGQMLKTKECLFLEPENMDNKFNILDGIIFKILAHGEKGHLHLIVDMDGIAVPMSLKSMDENREMHMFPKHYVSINLNELLYSCIGDFAKEMYRPECNKNKPTKKEQNIINELRMKKTQKLIIEKDIDGQPKYMITEQTKNMKDVSLDKLCDIDTNFGEMNVAFADGKPVSVHVKKRKKL